MNTLLHRTLATLILTGVSAAALAVPSTFDNQPRYSVGGTIETSPQHLALEDTYRFDNNQDQLEPAPKLEGRDYNADPLVTLPKLTWETE